MKKLLLILLLTPFIEANQNTKKICTLSPKDTYEVEKLVTARNCVADNILEIYIDPGQLSEYLNIIASMWCRFDREIIINVRANSLHCVLHSNKPRKYTTQE